MRVGLAAGMMALGGVMGAVELDAQQATLPAPSTQGIAEVVVLCLVVDRSVERLRLQESLCNQVRDIAREGAAVPVRTIGFGDPILMGRDVLGVLVHVAVDRSGPVAHAVLHIRPHRAAADATVLFGATPVQVPLAADGTLPHAAIAAALDQVLPWRMRARR